MTLFSVWAPEAERVGLLIEGGPTPLGRPMDPKPGGWFELEMPDAGPGTRYEFVVDGSDPLPDPRSPWQPDGIEAASAVVFGSDYRTAPGHAEPGTSAQHLLDGGSVPVAIAAAGLRTQQDGAIRSIAVPLAGPTNDPARQTARALAEKLDAEVVKSSGDPVDLIVVGSQPGAPEGHVVVGGDVRAELSGARSSVLVLPAGVAIAP